MKYNRVYFAIALLLVFSPGTSLSQTQSLDCPGPGCPAGTTTVVPAPATTMAVVPTQGFTSFSLSTPNLEDLCQSVYARTFDNYGFQDLGGSFDSEQALNEQMCLATIKPYPHVRELFWSGLVKTLLKSEAFAAGFFKLFGQKFCWKLMNHLAQREWLREISFLKGAFPWRRLHLLGVCAWGSLIRREERTMRSGWLRW